ncbi:MAG: alpha/beta hydrolase [Lachnospiraceae bacterium]|nr:alpha/beta hydrolase [Lachnospiraceae bacterium]
MSEQEVSLRGKTAREIVRVANHLPLIGKARVNGDLQNLRSDHELPWRCPEQLRQTVIDMEDFSMELLAPAGQEDPPWARHVILQLHGGGYYGRFHNTYRDAAAKYIEVSGGADVLSPDYRVAPEHPFPAALEDAVEAYRWLLEHDYSTERIVVAGDSAGGGLSLALGLYLRDHGMPMPAGFITMSAWTDLTKSGDSYQEKYDSDPIFGGTRKSLVYKEGYYADHDPMDPYISPVNGDFRGFPPMLMQVGEMEMLLDDTLSVAARARFAGGRVRVHVYKGMWHIFQMGIITLQKRLTPGDRNAQTVTLYPEATEAWKEIERFLEIVWR